jgi:hypothetical protein
VVVGRHQDRRSVDRGEASHPFSAASMRWAMTAAPRELNCTVSVSSWRPTGA